MTAPPSDPDTPPSPWRRPARLVPILLVIVSLGLATFSLGGGWIYDDLYMVHKKTMDGLDDLSSVLAHDSDWYTHDGPTPGPTTSWPTYRPATMASLIAVNVASDKSPLAQRGVSWLLHLAAMLLLWRLVALRRDPGGALPASEWTLAALFGTLALHPALCEAYYWVNGRSDLLAGLALAIFGVGLSELDRAEASSRRKVVAGSVVALAALLGVLAKAPFALAAATLLAAFLLPARGLALSHTRQALGRLWPALLALPAGVGLYLLLRSQAAAATGGRPPTELFELGTLAKLPPMLGSMVESLVVVGPRSMRMLAWEVHQPWDLPAIFWLALLALSLGALVWRQRWRTLVLVLGALACTLPVVLVSEFFWFGLDRYLYMPLCLLIVALADLPPLPARLRRGALSVACVLLALAVFANGATSRIFHDQNSFIEGMISQRPEDPSGYLLGAQHALASGQPQLAISLLERVPTELLPPPIARKYIELLLAVGAKAQAIATIGDAAARWPDNLDLKVDLMVVRKSQKRWPEIVQLSTELVHSVRHCAATVELLQRWSAQPNTPADARQRMLEVARQAPCQPAPP